MDITRALMTLVIAGLAAGNAEAAEKKKKAPPPPAEAPAPVKTAADVAHEKLHEAWTGKLEGAWSLELHPMAPEQAARHDTLMFTGRRVESEMLKQDGHGGSNFTLTPQDEQLAIWETMQIAPEGDRALWRGEVRDAAMSGTLIRQPKDGEALTWSFKGTKQTVMVPPETEAGTTPEP